MKFFDTHAHLDDDQFDDVAAVVAAARDVGVEEIVAIGTTAESSGRCVQLACDFPGVAAAVGIQPNYTQDAQEGDWDAVRQLAGRQEVVAIGETGLDHYWDFASLETQRDYFRRHILLSQELGKPLVIHMRDPQVDAGQSPSRSCQEEIYAVLAESVRQHPLTGVMHSYTGDAEMAVRFVELGLYVSFAGMVTYPKSDQLREVAATIPADQILIETDAPYLSPHPVRGTRPNQPALVVHTAQCLADCRGVTLEQFADRTTANARRLFGMGV